MTSALCYGHLGGAHHELVNVFWLAVTGASRLQVLRLLKGDAISGRYGYQRWPPCSGIQRVAMQTLPAASVQFFTGGCAKPVKVKR